MFDSSHVQIGLVNYRLSNDEPHVVCSMSGRLTKDLRGMGLVDSEKSNPQILQLFPQLTSELFVTASQFVRPGMTTKLYQWVSVVTIATYC